MYSYLFIEVLLVNRFSKVFSCRLFLIPPNHLTIFPYHSCFLALLSLRVHILTRYIFFNVIIYRLYINIHVSSICFIFISSTSSFVWFLLILFFLFYSFACKRLSNPLNTRISKTRRDVVCYTII